MTIKGIGHDLLSLSRIREVIRKRGAAFCKKTLTLKEQSSSAKYRDPVPFIGGRFAGKEAVAKSLNVGLGKRIGLLDIEILPNPDGAPIVSLSEKVKMTFDNPHILLSITHCRAYISAVAIWI